MTDSTIKHVLDRVGPFADKRSEQFNVVFSKLHHPHKQRYERLLSYVDSLLDAWNCNGNEELKYLHIHFPFYEMDHVIILEYLCIKLFLLTKSDSNSAGEGIGYMREHINLIERELRKDMHLSEENSKAERKQKTNHRKQLRYIKDSLEALEALDMDTDSSIFRPKYLVNVLKKDKEVLLNTSAPSPFFMSIDDFSATDLSRPISYILLNDQLGLNELDAMEIGDFKDILEHIEYIILFNSDGKALNREFSFPGIKRLNAEGLNIKRLILLSFDNRPFKLEKLISKLDTIVTRFLERTALPEANSYTIMPWEVDALTNAKHRPRPSIELIGAESLYWRKFQEFMNEQEELNELTSIKMRNIYSLCTSEEYKKIVLTDLFNYNSTSGLLSIETRDVIKRLEQDEQEKLKSLLTHVLDAVQQQRLFARMSPLSDQESYCIILAQSVIDHPDLIKLVMWEVQNYLPRATFKGWKEVKPQFSGNVIILDYRDPGRYPFRFHPNILEYTHSHAKSILAFFLTMFFQYNYEYAQFEYNRVLYSRVIDHPIRKEAFEWDILRGLIKMRMADQSYDHLWDLDNNYSNLSEREMLLVTFSKGSKNFYPNDLFVACYQDDSRLVILKAEDVHEERAENRKLFIQPLEDLYEGGNLFETTIEEESEIKVLKSQFQLDDRIADSGIWKKLLIRMVEKKSVEKVYEEVQVALSQFGLNMVKENYFQDNWLNVKSDLLIPRSKKVFKLMCEYLSLPVVYFRVMLKKKAKERLASRKSNAQMNRLISKLVEMGLLNEYHPNYTFDKEFMLKYDLEEIGFNIETLANDLYAFADLCKANLDLREVIYTEFKQTS